MSHIDYVKGLVFNHLNLPAQLFLHLGWSNRYHEFFRRSYEPKVHQNLLIMTSIATKSNDIYNSGLVPINV